MPHQRARWFAMTGGSVGAVGPALSQDEQRHLIRHGLAGDRPRHLPLKGKAWGSETERASSDDEGWVTFPPTLTLYYNHAGARGRAERSARGTMSDLINTLQFFAAGGPGAAASAPGAAADTGVTTADAGRTDDQLGLSRELSGTQRPGQTDGTPGGEDWDSFMSRPENRSRLQSMMAERGKKAGEALRLAAQERERLAPLLAALAEQYGVTAGENGPDLAALERAVNARGARPSDTAEPPPAPGGAANPGEVGTADAESDPDARNAPRKNAFLQHS